ncbi:MAG: DinB family protein [Anaerolineae bacterium]
MNTELIHLLYDYNYWAHQLVWNNSINALSNADFERSLDYSWGSVKAQVVHTMSSEWMWFQRLNGTSPAAQFNPADYPDRASIRTQWSTIESQVRAYLSTLSADKLQGTFTYSTTSGKTYTQKVGEILLHVVNHGTDHRAQTLAMLARLGAPTVEQDLIFYLRERAMG